MEKKFKFTAAAPADPECTYPTPTASASCIFFSHAAAQHLLKKKI
jgi:hypothetical protein